MTLKHTTVLEIRNNYRDLDNIINRMVTDEGEVVSAGENMRYGDSRFFDIVWDEERNKARIMIPHNDKYQIEQYDFNGGNSADDMNMSNCSYNKNNSLTYKAGSSHSHKFVDFDEDRITKSHFTDDDGIDGHGKAYFAVFLEKFDSKIVVEIT